MVTVVASFQAAPISAAGKPNTTAMACMKSDITAAKSLAVAKFLELTKNGRYRGDANDTSVETVWEGSVRYFNANISEKS